MPLKRTAILALGITVAIVILGSAVIQPQFKEMVGALVDVFVPGFGVEGLHDPTPEAAADEPVLPTQKKQNIVVISSPTQCYQPGIEKLPFPIPKDTASLLSAGDDCAEPGIGSVVGCPAGNGRIELLNGSCGCEPTERIIAIRVCLTKFQSASSSSK